MERADASICRKDEANFLMHAQLTRRHHKFNSQRERCVLRSIKAGIITQVASMHNIAYNIE